MTKVNANVYFTNPDTGETVFVEAGKDAPSWADVGDHLTSAEDLDLIGEEPVAGPSQSALTKRQAAELQAAADAEAKSSAQSKSSAQAKS